VSPWAALALIPFAACALAIMLARHRFMVVTVTGTSMEPALHPGDRVLVRRHRCPPVRAGDILVFREPGGQQAIKRVAARAGDAVPDSVQPVTGGAKVVPPGKLVLLGDAARSGDSRQWGFIPADQTLGLVIRRLPRQASLSGQRTRPVVHAVPLQPEPVSRTPWVDPDTKDPAAP
jgi:signal peptidase I